MALNRYIAVKKRRSLASKRFKMVRIRVVVTETRVNGESDSTCAKQVAPTEPMNVQHASRYR